MRNPIAAILAAATLLALAGCDGQAQPAASSMMRYQADSTSQRSWWLARDGVTLHEAANAKGRFIALPQWLWAHSPLCPPALGLGPKGEALVTSNVTSTVWRVDPDTLAVTVHALSLNADNDKDVGFVAVAYAPAQAAFVAYSESPPAVWKIDRELTRAVKVSNVDLSRMRSQRAPSVLGPCADLAHRLTQFAGTAD